MPGTHSGTELHTSLFASTRGSPVLQAHLRLTPAAMSGSSIAVELAPAAGVLDPISSVALEKQEHSEPPQNLLILTVILSRLGSELTVVSPHTF